MCPPVDETPQSSVAKRCLGCLPANPVLFQVNCRVLLRELCDLSSAKQCTLDDIPDGLLEIWRREVGADILYLLGVWTTGTEGVRKAKEVVGHLHLPSDQICSSPFAVVAYDVHPDFGGDEALDRLRCRLAKHGLRLLVDFVPNHVAVDHPWLQTQQTIEDYIMPGNDNLCREQPHNYMKTSSGRVIAHGKDPHFDGWTDTAQLNYFSQKLRNAQKAVLHKVCTQVDAVRCDMAMLVCSEQLQRTWGERYRQATGKSPDKPPEFWREAIAEIKQKNPDFFFIAEVYWNMEGALMEQGFEYCYDKGLYDRLLVSDCGAVKEALVSSSLQHQQSLVRFLENHDEPRAAQALPNIDQHLAAAVLTYLAPGLKFFHFGQLDGRRERLQMQREKLPNEPPNGDVRNLYLRLLAVLKRPAFRNGYYYTLDVRPSSHGSQAHNHLVAFLWIPRSPLRPAPLCPISASSGGADTLPCTHSPNPMTYGNVSSDNNPAMVVVNYGGAESANGFVVLRCSAGTTPVRSHCCAAAPPPPCCEGLVRRLPSTCLTLCQTALIHFTAAVRSHQAPASSRVQPFDDTGYAKEVEGHLAGGENRQLLLRDILGSVEAYTRSLGEFKNNGIWFNIKPWGAHVYELQLL